MPVLAESNRIGNGTSLEITSNVKNADKLVVEREFAKRIPKVIETGLG